MYNINIDFFRYHLSQFSNPPWVYDRNEVCFYVKLILDNLKNTYARGNTSESNPLIVTTYPYVYFRMYSKRCDVAVVLDNAELSTGTWREVSTDEAEHDTREVKAGMEVFTTC